MYSKIPIKYELSTTLQYWVNEFRKVSLCEVCDILTDQQISQKQSFSAGEMYSTIDGVIILVLVWRKSAHFDEDMHKMHIFVSSDLDLWPLDLKFAAQLLLSNAICFR